MTKLLIAGTGTSTDNVTFNQRFFGTAMGPVAPFVLASSFEWFVGRFRKIYDDALHELRAEHESSGKFTPPYDGATSYPTCDELFALTDMQRMEVVNSFFTLDILRLFFTQEAERSHWAVRYVDGIARNGDAIELRGRVEKL